MRCALLALTLVAAGCLSPRADVSTFFLLTSAEAPGAVGPPLGGTLGLGPVTLPGYLDRSELVTRLSDNQVAVSPTARWAEPLRDNVLRALSQNLVRVLGPDDYVFYHVVRVRTGRLRCLRRLRALRGGLDRIRHTRGRLAYYEWRPTRDPVSGRFHDSGDHERSHDRRSGGGAEPGSRTIVR